jgi:ligand-binding sensor domain-containing protein
MQKPLKCLLVVILMQVFLAKGHAQNYVFRNFGQEAGLPVTGINHMIFDSRGLFWLATDGGGLVQWNGFEFLTFGPKQGLPALYINHLLETPEGHLLISTTQGLFAYDGMTFKTIIHNENVYCTCDHDANRQLVGTNAGLIELQTGQKISSEAVKLCLKSAEGIWLGTEYGLILHAEGGPSKTYLKGEEIKSLLLVEDDLYVGTNLGLRKGDVGKRPLKFSNQPIPSQREFADVRGLAKDALGNIWAASFINGLAAWSQAGDPFFYAGQQEGLPQGRVRALLADPYGRIWMSTLAGFTSLTDWRVKNHQPQAGAVSALHLSPKGDWFFGTATGVQFPDSKNLSDDFPPGLVFNIRESPGGHLWFATESGLLEHHQGKLKNWSTHILGKPMFVFSVLPEADRIIFGSADGLHELRENRISRISPNVFANKPVNGLIRLHGDLIVSTIGAGVFRINKHGIVSKFRNSEKWNVASMAVQNDILYLGTNGFGLKIVDGQKIFSFGPTEGLRSGNVWAIAPGKGQVIWLGSEKGIQGIIPVKQQLVTFRTFSAKSGLLDQEITKNGLLWDSVGERLLAGTGKGLAEIQILENPGENLAPTVHISNLQLFFKTPDTTLVRQPFTGLLQKGRFKHDENYLSFSFSATSAFDQEKLSFRYKLRGQDQSWTYPESKREAVFTNIQPGPYTLEVEATTGFGSNGKASYAFEISPAFWQTYWFWTTLILVLVGGVFWLVRQRIRALNARLILESEKADLERKALRLQMNPHFIFNALDGITAFIFKNDPKSAVRYLSNFAKLMRLTLESSREAFIPIETEINILKNYLELEQLRFSESFSYDIILDSALDPYDQIPPMMIQPHVENAILHGLRPKGTGGLVTIHFSKSETGICCTIADNGIGRKAAAAIKERSGTYHKSLAGEITENRIALMRKSFGRHFTFKIEDLENPTGTKVTIQLPLHGGD